MDQVDQNFLLETEQKQNQQLDEKEQDQEEEQEFLNDKENNSQIEKEEEENDEYENNSYNQGSYYSSESSEEENKQTNLTLNKSYKKLKNGKKLKHHIHDLSHQVSSLQEQSDRILTLRQTVEDQRQQQHTSRSSSKHSQEEPVEQSPQIDPQVLIEGRAYVNGMSEDILKQARIQKLFNKNDRSQLNNFDTMKWLNKRFANKTKDQYRHLPDQLAQERTFKEIFQVFDEDNNKCLDEKEIHQLFKKYNVDIQKRQLKLFLKTIRTSKNGLINIDEFLHSVEDTRCNELFRHIIRSIKCKDNSYYDPNYLERKKPHHLHWGPPKAPSTRNHTTQAFQDKLKKQRELSIQHNLDNTLRTVRQEIETEVYHNHPPPEQPVAKYRHSTTFHLEDTPLPHPRPHPTPPVATTHHSQYMPCSFGEMMNYISYKEQREKILQQIRVETDINKKYTQFSKLVGLESKQVNDDQQQSVSHYKQKLKMKGLLVSNQSLRKVVQDKENLQKQCQLAESIEEQGGDLLKEEGDKQQLAHDIYLQQLKGLQQEAHLKGRQEAHLDNTHSLLPLILPDVSISNSNQNNNNNNNNQLYNTLPLQQNMSTVRSIKQVRSNRQGLNQTTVDTHRNYKHTTSTGPHQLYMRIGDQKGITKILNSTTQQVVFNTFTPDNHSIQQQQIKQMSKLRSNDVKLPQLQNITKQYTIPYENLSQQKTKKQVQSLVSKYK